MDQNDALDAFRARFSRNRDINEFTPFGFFEAGYAERSAEVERLRALVLSADSMLSLIVFRGHVNWGGPVPEQEEARQLVGKLRAEFESHKAR
jgi:hypothetical protein